jgi:hypothetical protein
MAIRGNITPPVVPLVPKAAPVKDDRPTPVTNGSSALALQPQALPLEGTIEPLELVKIDPKNRLELFTVDGALNVILEGIATRARSFVQDVTTKKGRDNIASLAYSIAKVKTALEKEGVALNKELKETPALVDKNKKAAWNFLEALQTERRQPLTEWEAEQARIEAERVAAEAAAALARTIEADHDIALTLNRAYDREKHDEFAALEKAAQEHEEEIAREAAEKERKASAQREADLKAAAEKAEQDKRDAEARAEQAKRDAEAAAAKAKKDAAELAEKNRLAAIQAQKDSDDRAEQAAILARQQEQQRQAAAEKALKDAQDLRERNRKHRHRIHTEALEDLIKAGIDPEAARAVIGVLRESKVRHLSIAY